MYNWIYCLHRLKYYNLWNFYFLLYYIFSFIYYYCYSCLSCLLYSISWIFPSWPTGHKKTSNYLLYYFLACRHVLFWEKLYIITKFVQQQALPGMISRGRQLSPRIFAHRNCYPQQFQMSMFKIYKLAPQFIYLRLNDRLCKGRIATVGIIRYEVVLKITWSCQNNIRGNTGKLSGTLNELEF